MPIKRRSIAHAIVTAIFASATATASTITLPNSAANSVIWDTRYTVFHVYSRTLQWQVAASQLTALPVGASIDGIGFRTGLNGRTAYGQFADWRLTVAQAAHPVSEMSTTFADNMINPVVVREGPLSVRGDIVVAFPMPYEYRGGDLVLHLTHSGSGQFGALGLYSAVEPSQSNPAFRALWSQGYNATSSEMIDYFTVIGLSFNPVPEPDAWLSSGFALVAIVTGVRKTYQAARIQSV